MSRNPTETPAFPPVSPGECVVLSPWVRVVMADNPSPFTYLGTRTHLIGSEGDVAVIDPGPADAAHLDALQAAIGDARLKAILCTHTHRDHSPGAAPLRARTGAPVMGCAPLAHADHNPPAGDGFDLTYAPDRVLADGEQITGTGWTLTAVATPGHTSNHLCFALEEEQALFSGDHVMGWSTSVIAPPDGDMGAYMASLDRLMTRDDRLYYPAHGDPVPNPRRLVRGLAGHRRQREGQILRLLERGTGALTAMVDHMYAGLDPRLAGAAGRSVLAHLIDLEKRGRVVRSGDGWQINSMGQGDT